ncbi:hypothetical protein B5E53_07915 [Eubacterium sp. An11]|nr:hypothetical protein B5E53_07915 [Eubacterium sp. An11]
MKKNQELFNRYMPRVKVLYRKMRENVIMDEEKEELFDLRRRLFEGIKRYGFLLATNRIERDGAYLDTVAEIESELFIVFCDTLEKYDTFYAVTTYFKWHFWGAICRYFAKQGGKTQYHIQKMAKISWCIQKCEEMQIDCIVKNIAEMTGMTERLVKKTLEEENRSQLISLDKLYSRRDKGLTPEEVIVQKECRDLLDKSARRNLSEKEYELFCCLFCVNFIKNIPYKKMAEQTGYSLMEVKELIQSIKNKMSGDETLRQYFYGF